MHKIVTKNKEPKKRKTIRLNGLYVNPRLEFKALIRFGYM